MTKNPTLNLAEIRAELLSIVAKADGEVKNVENMTAEAIIESSGALNETFAKELYHWSVTSEIMPDEKDDLLGQLYELPLPEKLSIVRALWAVAIADGVIHPAEKREIQQVMKVMGIDESMVNKADI